MSVPSRFLDSLYINWLRCASSLVILKESLHGYIEVGVGRLYDNVKLNVTTSLHSHFQCSACSWKGIHQQPSTGVWSIRCSICNVWLVEILKKHDDPKSRTINWGNADITKWSFEPWEIAKIFMTNGQRNKTDLPQELDSPALLSLLKYCKEFHPINVQLVSDIIEIRNKVLHSPDLRVCDTDKDAWIDKMLSLISSLTIQGVAYTEIDKLKTEDISVNFRDQEIKALQNQMLEVLNEVTTLNGDSESLKNTRIQHQQEIDKYAQVISKLKTFIENNPDLPNMNITAALRELQKQFQTFEETIKGELIYVRADHEALKTEMRVEHEAMKGEITGVKDEQEKMRNRMENLALDQRDKKTDIQSPTLSADDIQRLQKELLNCYKSLNVIPISPLSESYTKQFDNIFTRIIIEKRDEQNLVNSQEQEHSKNSKEPLYLRSYHQHFGNIREQEQPRNSKEPIYLRSYQQLFGDKGNKRLILTGFMGSGKSMFCRKVVQTWCRVKTTQLDAKSAGDRQVDSTSTLDGEDILSQFEFLLFIDLAKVNQAVDTSSKEAFLDAILCSIDTEDKNFLHNVLKYMPEKILIILDGLDEMGSKTPKFVNDLLERKLHSQIVVFISTRPWQISKLSLQAHSHYDLLLDVQGFDEESALCFATKVIHAHDMDVGDNLIEDMIESLTRKKIFATFRSVPLLLLFLTNVWYYDRSLPNQYSVLYMKIIDCMTEHCLKKTKEKHRNHKWFEMSDSKTKLMESSVFVKTFGNAFLELTSKLSYDFLLQRQQGTTVIMSREKLLESLDKDEKTAESKLQVLLDCGIFSKSDAPSPLNKNYSVSFLHLSIQEFLVAVYLTSNEVVFQEFISTWTCLDDVLQYENVVIFICGLAPKLGEVIFNCICQVCDEDSKVLKYREGLVFSQEGHAIENLCSLYRICFNEVKGSALLPLSDIVIKGSLAQNESEDFLCMTLNLGLTFKVKSFNLCSLLLSADHSESLCEVISNCTHLQSLDLEYSTLHESILDLSTLTGLTYLRLWNVTLSSECAASLCRSINNCAKLQYLGLSVITLHDSILDLSSLTGLTNLSLWYITMSSECSECLCKSISKCTHLENLHLSDISLHGSILDLSRLRGLTNLSLRYVTMPNECTESLCSSISNCTQLQNLHLIGISLHDSIIDLCRSTGLTELELWNVTMTSECSKSLCRSVSNLTHLQTLRLSDITLCVGILDLSSLTGLIDLMVWNVDMSSECIQSLCTSISNCAQLQTLDLKNITLDIAFDLSKLTGLTVLSLNVIIPCGCIKSLCRSISNCTHLQTLHLNNIFLYDSILDLSSLTGLTHLSLWYITMSSECSKSLCRSISNCKHLKNLYLSDISLHDSILDLERLTSLRNLHMRYVTVSRDCSKSLCRSITICTQLQTLHLNSVSLHDSIYDLSRLMDLRDLMVWNVPMSSECSKMLCRSINNCTQLQTLDLENITLHDNSLDLSRLIGLTNLRLSGVTMSSECNESLCRSISNCTHLQTRTLSDITLCDRWTNMTDLYIADIDLD